MGKSFGPARLEQAEQAALSRTLTTAQARKLFNEVLERSGDLSLFRAVATRLAAP
jgi:hypothetical protein